MAPTQTSTENPLEAPDPDFAYYFAPAFPDFAYYFAPAFPDFAYYFAPAFKDISANSVMADLRK